MYFHRGLFFIQRSNPPPVMVLTIHFQEIHLVHVGYKMECIIEYELTSTMTLLQNSKFICCTNTRRHYCIRPGIIRSVLEGERV